MKRSLTYRPASQPTSSSPSLHPQTKKKKSSTRGANPAHLLPKAAYTKVDTTNPPSFLEFQAHAATTATADGGEGQDALALIPAKGVVPCEALRNVPKNTVTETVNVNGDLTLCSPEFMPRTCPGDARCIVNGTKPSFRSVLALALVTRSASAAMLCGLCGLVFSLSGLC